MNPRIPPGQRTPEIDEYRDQRDIARFWKEAAPRREPARRRSYIPLLLLITTISVPWYWPGGETGAVFAGLPLWVWVTVLCSIAVSVVTASAALRHWDDDETVERDRGH